MKAMRIDQRLQGNSNHEIELCVAGSLSLKNAMKSCMYSTGEEITNGGTIQI